MNLKKISLLSFLLLIAGAAIYYFYPVQKIPDGVVIDKIIVSRFHRELLAWSKGKLIATYIIAIGKNPLGDKEYEGDNKTPEGFYTINDKNPNSEFNKNPGIELTVSKTIIVKLQADMIF